MAHRVLPVVHHLDADTSVAQAMLALRLGADGVFFISHDGFDDELFEPAALIKELRPDKAVGLNLLSRPALDAARSVAAQGLDMVWLDAPGVTSRGMSADGAQLALWLREHPELRCFGSVAFKYQPPEPQPGEAARQAAAAGMLPTTSGAATGSPPALEKAVDGGGARRRRSRGSERHDT